MDTGKPKLLDQMKTAIRIKHYSLKTEKSYVHWVRRYIYFHNKKHPAEMGAIDVQKFLSYLAIECFEQAIARFYPDYYPSLISSLNLSSPMISSSRS